MSADHSYAAGCRCADCRAEHAADARDYRGRTGNTVMRARRAAVAEAARRYKAEHPREWQTLSYEIAERLRGETDGRNPA